MNGHQQQISVYHLTPVWSDTPMVDTRGLVAKIQKKPDGDLEVLLMVPVQVKGEEHPRYLLCPFDAVLGKPVFLHAGDKSDAPKMTAWGLRKLGPGVWNVEPSIRTQWGLHAYVTIIDVPEPAPFVEAPTP